MHNKGNYKQGEKTALRLGENNSKQSNRQRINLKNKSHLLKGICLYVKSNGNPQRLHGEWLPVLHHQMPTVMKDTDVFQV